MLSKCLCDGVELVFYHDPAIIVLNSFDQESITCILANFSSCAGPVCDRTLRRDSVWLERSAGFGLYKAIRLGIWLQIFQIKNLQDLKKSRLGGETRGFLGVRLWSGLGSVFTRFRGVDSFFTGVLFSARSQGNVLGIIQDNIREIKTSLGVAILAKDYNEGKRATDRHPRAIRWGHPHSAQRKPLIWGFPTKWKNLQVCNSFFWVSNAILGIGNARWKELGPPQTPRAGYIIEIKNGLPVERPFNHLRETK